MKKATILLTCFVLLLCANSCEEEKYVIQSNPDEFAVYPLVIAADSEGGSYELKITGNESWTLSLEESNSSAANWCTLSQDSGSGVATVTVNVTPSTSFVKNRSIIIRATSSNTSLRSKVLQQTMVLGEDEVLINGQVWSTKNVDAPGTFVNSPDEIGMYYQFNRKVGYPSSGNSVPSNWPSSYTNDGTNWVEENDPSPEGWRIPTTAEMVALWNIGATWVRPAQTGFKVAGIIVGIPADLAATATKDNLKQLGGLFLPQSGWRSGNGLLDRTWLVAVRSSTSLNNSHGGMSLGDSGGYRDIWGWGDGQKDRAGMIRPVKKISVED